MKVWITKYALSEGIFTVDGKVSDYAKNMVSYRRPGQYTQYAHGNDWHTTAEAAAKRAEEMRVKKIASLRQQIKNLEALTFEVDS